MFARVGSELAWLADEAPTVIFRRQGEIRRLVNSNPFQDRANDPGIKLYVTFLAERAIKEAELPPCSPREGLEHIGFDGLDVFVVSRRKKKGFYGIPNRFIEMELGVLATSRNWSTVKRKAALAEG